MSEERQSSDPTRRLLRMFGVTVTNYEERTARLLERASEPDLDLADLTEIVARVLELTVELDRRLRDITVHVLERQTETLERLQASIVRHRSGEE